MYKVYKNIADRSSKINEWSELGTADSLENAIKIGETVCKNMYHENGEDWYFFSDNDIADEGFRVSIKKIK